MAWTQCIYLCRREFLGRKNGCHRLGAPGTDTEMAFARHLLGINTHDRKLEEVGVGRGKRHAVIQT